MLSTSARLLRLAALLQARRHWPGRALAERLEVDARTLRRDIDRLRTLGYPVQASSGRGGGYSLGSGTTLPPLVLDDTEAVTLAVALRAATATVAGIEAPAQELLAKLDQWLPARLRRRATALHSVTLSLDTPTALADATVLTTIATACRDTCRLRFGYRNHDGDASERNIEPARLINYGRRWDLVGWDTDRGDWRTFEHRITVRLQGRADTLAEMIPAWCGVLVAETDDSALLHIGGDSADTLLATLCIIGRPFELLEGESEVPALLATHARVGEALGQATIAPRLAT